MSKSFQILLLCALFLEFSHSLSLLEAEKIPSNPREEQSYYDEEPTDNLDIEIGFNLPLAVNGTGLIKVIHGFKFNKQIQEYI